LECILFY